MKYRKHEGSGERRKRRRMRLNEMEGFLVVVSEKSDMTSQIRPSY
jgi:hypothetical protein